MKVVPLTKKNESLWDEFVENEPGANLYHLLGWKTVYRTVFGFIPHYFLALDSEDKVAGILPMFLMRDILRKKYLVSCPFSNFAGVCAATPEAAMALTLKAKEIADAEGVEFIEFRQLGEKLPDDLPLKESFVTLMLKLPDDHKEMWTGLSSKARNKIRLARKNGLEPAFGMEYLPDFYDVYAKNMRYLGTPVFPFKLFRVITEQFSDRVDLLVLKHEGRPVSGMFYLKFRNVLSEPWAASLREFNRLKVNNLLYWRAIEYACDNGFEYLDFGRSTRDTGTDIFKRQWGAEPVQLYYQYYLNQTKEIPVVDANNNKYEKAINVWKKLPLRITNLIGPRVVQYLPEL